MKKYVEGLVIVLLVVAVALLWRDVRAAKTVVVVYPTPPVVAPDLSARPTPAAADGATNRHGRTVGSLESTPEAAPKGAEIKDAEKVVRELVSKASLMVRDAVVKDRSK